MFYEFFKVKLNYGGLIMQIRIISTSFSESRASSLLEPDEEIQAANRRKDNPANDTGLFSAKIKRFGPEKEKYMVIHSVKKS